MEAILNILKLVGVIFLALMILNVMIVVHEWGHFLAARWRGLKIEKFQIWFGKAIWSRTYNGVQYGLGTIPAGGFVALPQMAPMEAIEGREEPREELPPITPLDKIIVAFAGPLFSFLLAVLISFGVWVAGRPMVEPPNPTMVGYINPDYPVAESGLRPGDIIREIDGKKVDRWGGQVSSVVWGVVSSEGETIDFTVERDGELLTIPVKPVMGEADEKPPANAAGRAFRWIFGRPPLRSVGIEPQAVPRVGAVLPHSPAEEAGIKVGDVVTGIDGRPVTHPSAAVDIIRKAEGRPVTFTLQREGREEQVQVTPRRPDRPADAAHALTGVYFGEEKARTVYVHQAPGEQIAESLQAMKNLLGKIVSPGSDISATHMGGPVMIVRIYTNFLSLPFSDAWRWILWFSVVLNVNLAVMNMLPFPVLDGGHITMALLEWARRRPLNVKVLEWVQTACVLLVLSFFIMVTLKDVGDISRKNQAPEFLPRGEERGS